MGYKYFLFDWDGCIAKTLDIWLEASRQVYDEYGLKPTDQEIAHHFGDWEAPKHFGVTDVATCMDRIAGLANQQLKQVALYDGAKELLHEIAKTKKLALLSSSERQVLDWGLEYNGMSDLFHVVISGDEVVHHKPDPEVIEKSLLALNGSKEHAVMIGDSRKDIEAANNAGIDSILIFPESHKLFYDLEKLRQYSPTYIVSGFLELKGLIC